MKLKSRLLLGLSLFFSLGAIGALIDQQLFPGLLLSISAAIILSNGLE